MTARKQSALLLMLICIFAACSEHDDSPLLEEQISKELVEGTTIGSPKNAEQKNPVEADVAREPVEDKGIDNLEIANPQVENPEEAKQRDPVEMEPPMGLNTPTFRLAAWNIRIFSDGSRNDDELHQIAKVLTNYDFIAIVELRDEVVLMRTEVLLDGMGRDYDYIISPPVGAKVKERYAFLFDPQIVHVIEDGEVFPDPNDVFLREPYFATFKAGEFDFTAIAVHVIWGDSVNRRRREVQELANVYQAVQAADEDEQDVILLGDFNRNPDDQLAYGPLLSIRSMGHLFRFPQKSHIKDTSLYDNIFFQTNHVTEYTGESGIERFDEAHFGNDDAAASLAVSDHRPIWGTFRIDVDDDGLDLPGAPAAPHVWQHWKLQ